MEVQTINTESNTNTVSVRIGAEEYMPKVRQELKELRGKAQIKGFRKGKTPMGLLRKMYGQSLMLDAINKAVQEKLFQYIEKEELNMIGYPIPSEEQKEFNFNVNQPGDFEFLFDIGIVPDFEVKGADESAVYTWYDTVIPEDHLEEQLELARKRAGQEEEVEGEILEEDALLFHAVEWEDGSPKEGGHETDFRVLVKSLAEGDMKDKILAAGKGGVVVFDIYELEKDMSEEMVRRYLLNLEQEDEREVGRMYEGEIREVRRLKPAEIDQEFFDQVFGPGKVTSEEEAKEHFRKEIKEFYDRQADEILYGELYERIRELNKVELPETFLRRWLGEVNENDVTEKAYRTMLEDYQWSVVRDRLMKELDIVVEQEDIKEGFRSRLRQYMQGYAMDDAFYDSMIDRMMQDKEQVEKQAAEVSVGKLFRTLKDRVTLEKKEIGMEEFKEVIEEENRKAEQMKRGASEEEE